MKTNKTEKIVQVTVRLMETIYGKLYPTDTQRLRNAVLESADNSLLKVGLDIIPGQLNDKCG